MKRLRTNVVDTLRLTWPKWEDGKQTGAGNIYASYSADSIASRSTVKRPFIWRGEAWAAVGLSSIEGSHQAEAFRLVVLRLFQGAATTYRARRASGQVARRDPVGFYHGVRVTSGGVEYVLSGPEERFVAGIVPSVEDSFP